MRSPHYWRTTTAILFSIFAGLAIAAEKPVLDRNWIVDQDAPSWSDVSRETPADIGIGPYSISPKSTGFPAPYFSLTGTSGNRVNINPKRLRRPLMLTFFRGGWCPYCQTQFSELRKIESELNDLGYDIWFVSPDRPELLSFGEQGPDSHYKLFSDSNLSAAMAFGIAYQLEAEVLHRYFSDGTFLRNFTGLKHTMLPVPSTFLIAKNGEIMFQYSSPDHTQRIDAGLLLTAAKVYSERSIAMRETK